MSARPGKRAFLSIPLSFLKRGQSQRYLGHKPEKREAQFCQNFIFLEISQDLDWQIAKILDRMRINFRTFKMYKYYGTYFVFGKRSFRILFCGEPWPAKTWHDFIGYNGPDGGMPIGLLHGKWHAAVEVSTWICFR